MNTEVVLAMTMTALAALPFRAVPLRGLWQRLTRLPAPGDAAAWDPATPSTREPRDCVLVLDASASMEARDWRPSRLGAAKEAAWAYAERLKTEEPDARIAVVAYGDDARTLCPLTPAARAHDVKAAIGRIETDGCTNITSGLEAALSLLHAGSRPCQVVLLSDGHHNTGLSPADVAAAIRAFAIVETVGIGGRPQDVDEQLLKSIASEYPDGTKRYRWIGDKATLIRHFRDLGGGLTRQP